MYPTILKLGPITLHSYGLMIAIGFITVLYFMQRDARRCGLDANAIGDTAFWTLILGVAATRLTHIILYPQYYSWSDPIGWINVTNGGLVFQGAIPAALIYCYWALKRRKQPFWAVADVVMPYVPVAQAFGRIGCFLKGCCHGSRADDLLWGVRFPEGSPAYYTQKQTYASFPPDAHWSYPVHPTQLYSVILLLCMCGLLLLARRKRNFVGLTFPLYFILYGMGRFFVEIFRGDGNPTQRWFGYDVTAQQEICVVMIAIGIAVWIVLYRRRDKTADPAFPGGAG